MMSDIPKLCAAGQGHGHFQFVAQQANDMGDAQRTSSSETPKIGSADKYGCSPEGHRDKCIAATTNAAIEQDGHATADTLHDIWQDLQAVYRTSQYATAVVRNHDAIAAEGQRVFCIVRVENAFEQQG
jgi:hypothetical protein